MKPSAGHQRRAIKSETYAFFLLLFALLLVTSHLPLLTLGYFWDEARQFISSARDILHNGWWIPHSAPPSIHPPGVMAYLADVWQAFGYHPAVTRCTMLLVASLRLLWSFLLAIELSRDVPGKPAFLAAGLLLLSPVFFSQAMMAQLDAPALALTTLALLLFLQDRVRASAAVCVVLVLVKETGLLAPAFFFCWLLFERRWRDALPFLLPAAALAIWMAALHRATGQWLGDAGFAHYNFWYPLHPVRLSLALFRRFYYLGIANFHWVGALAILYAWRRRVFRGRAWKVAALLAAAQIVMVTLLCGAVLERYLLPAMPIVYTAMALGVMSMPRLPQRVCAVILLAGLAAANFINPPYPFPYEDNLAWTDFVKLQMDAADYVEHWYSQARVSSAWPFTMEVTHPELGFVKSRMDARQIRNFSAASVGALNWNDVDVMVTFERSWDPQRALEFLGPMVNVWRKSYNYTPNLNMMQLRDVVPFPVEQHFERRGQWLDIYVRPGTPHSRPVDAEKASSGTAKELEQQDHLVLLVR